MISGKAGTLEIERSVFKYMVQNYWFQVPFNKVRVINLTQGGLRAMSNLEELERARGNGEYMDTKAGIAAANGSWIAGRGQPAMKCVRFF